ncbi:MAG TPA: tyrosine--tRNA ligase [Polyangiaceae bacterium]|jgi:tyrosyl-tRNA synthetase|nr:tyrosine--tRNA ligase [Polyangiaceae bacterium]
MHLLDDLAFRGLIHQQTNPDGLRAHLADPRVVYCGFDPTKDSLTIGNLVPILLLRRFQQAGHRPIVIMGGGTGMIGDPSGKDAERQLLSLEQIEQNIAGQRVTFERLLDFEGPNAAVLLNNADWLTRLGYLEVLREIGKYFSINMMIQKDSVKDRLQNREQGISYTEFSYMLLQAYDYLYLYEKRQVTLQVCGSDQWGNVVGGIDLIRRKHHAEAFGLTAPLVTKSDGGKFGKTEAGAIWLHESRTSAYAFYQFWLNTPDSDVVKYLKIFTFLSHEEIARLEAEHAQNPGARAAQRALAEHMTELLHEKAGLEQARSATEALFSGDVAKLSRKALEEVFESAPSITLPKAKLAGEGISAIDFLVEAQVVKSKREARELLSSNAVSVSARKADAETRITAEWLLFGEIALIRRGRKTWHVARFE